MNKDKLTSKFYKMSLEEKFGQTIMLGLDTYDINDEIKEIIEKYKIGGVILYKKNYASLETMITVINKLKKISAKNKIPLFIGIDQENGEVNRLPKDFLNIHGSFKQSKCNDLNIINAINEVTTYLLMSLGINMNFAPVLDINKLGKNKSIGSRSYGITSEEVIKNALPFMEFMQSKNIIPVIKHFPGHGEINLNSHLYAAKVSDINKLEQEDLKPFEMAIKKGADALMLNQIKIKGYGHKIICTNQKFIDKYLHEKLNYKGLIVTDDIRMGTMKYFYKTKKIIKNSINAGCNLVIVKYKKNDSKRLFKPLLEMVKYCEIDPELINNSAKKIIKIKEKYVVNDELINPKLNIELINDKIKKINYLIDSKIGE